MMMLARRVLLGAWTPGRCRVAGRWLAASATAAGRPDAPRVAFASLQLSPKTRAAIDSMGFEALTPVQAETLPRILAGGDILAKAKTGTGKTLAFLLPSIERMVGFPRTKTSVVILSPTRELAQQTMIEARTLSRFHGFNVDCVIGGSNLRMEQARLQGGMTIDVLVATPGRLLAHLRDTKGAAEMLDNLRIVVLDEADQLLDCGFQRDITQILSMLPAKDRRQTLLFSATIPKQVHNIVNIALRDDHEFIDTVGEEDTDTNPQVDQECAVVPFDKQLVVLESVLRAHMKECTRDFKVIVFFPTARVVGFCAKLFARAGLPILEMHSRKSQAARTKIADQFRKGSGLIMFTSDVSARGVDYPDVSLIVQVGLTTREQYIHRVGRTARAGRQGRGILLLAPFEQAMLGDLQDLPIKDIAGTPVVANARKSLEMNLALSDVPKDAALVKAGAQAYQAFLGFYNSHLRALTWSKDKLVAMANQFATIMGLKQVPAMQKKTVAVMGLRNTPGLRIE
ncbi:ATP-dependent RNA helicase [Plasmodiophora brassicae]